MNIIKRYLLILCLAFGMAFVTGCGSAAATDNNKADNVTTANVTSAAQNSQTSGDNQSDARKSEIESSVQAQIDEAKRQAGFGARYRGYRI